MKQPAPNRWSPRRRLLITACAVLMGVRVLLDVSGSSGFTASAQSNFAGEFQRKLDQYYARHTPIIIDMQLNQPAYVAGDTAWFSLWLTTEREAAPVAGRQIVQLNVMSKTGEFVLRQQVLASDGLARGQIVVPLSIQPGVYTIVASTKWMERAGLEGYCYKELIVSGDRTFKQASMPLRAFVEGGRLAHGVNNSLLVTGRPGATVSIHTDGRVFDRAQLDSLGYAKMSFIPDSANSYEVTDGAETVQLATATPGIAVSLTSVDSTATLGFRLESTLVHEGCQFVVVSRGKLLYAAMVKFQGQPVIVTIPKRIPPEGVLTATVFNASHEPIVERLFVANMEHHRIKITPPKEIFHPREQVSVSIEAPVAAAMPITVSIYADDLFQYSLPYNDDNPFSARLAKGTLDFKIGPSWGLNQWNAFLITQSWKRFSWSDVLSETTSGENQSEKYLRVSGKVDLNQSNASFDSVRVTFFLRHDVRLYELFVDPTGGFDLDFFFDFYGTEEIYYRIDRSGKPMPQATLNIRIDTTSGVKLLPYLQTANFDKYPSFAQLKRSITEAYLDYEAMARIDNRRDRKAAIEDEFFEPDVNIRLADYLPFPTMEETLREIVPRLQHRWRGKRHEVRVALSEPNLFAPPDPLYFIDGVLTDNTDFFMELDPGTIANIEIVTNQQKLRSMGMLGRNGVVFVTTKLDDNRLNVPRPKNSFDALGLAAYSPFDNNRRSSPRIPVLSSTVYFNPAMKVDQYGKATFEFEAPDNAGTFTIETTCLSDSGMLYKSVKQIRSVPPSTTP